MSSANMAEALANFQAERLPIVHEYQRTSREISQQIRANASKVWKLYAIRGLILGNQTQIMAETCVQQVF